MIVFECRAGKTKHLFGATTAEQQRPALLRLIGTTQPPGEVVLLDFQAVESVTASYLKASLLWLLEAGIRSAAETSELSMNAELPALNVFPMVCNINDEIRTELHEVLVARDRCCIEVVEASKNIVKRGRLLGKLDRVLEETVGILSDLRHPVGAVRLSEIRVAEDIKATGWNNRLALLHSARLVQRVREGRQWMYRLAAEEVRRG